MTCKDQIWWTFTSDLKTADNSEGRERIVGRYLYVSKDEAIKRSKVYPWVKRIVPVRISEIDPEGLE